MSKQHFMWIAFLDDKTVIPEYDGDGKENNYHELPKDRITHFGLQSPRASYVIDLSDGSFHLKSHRLAQKTSIQVPIKKQIFKIDGPLSGPIGQKYDFFQLKEAHNDFMGAPLLDENGQFQYHPNGQLKVTLASQGTIITKQYLGWKTQKFIQRLGMRYIKTTLSLETYKLNQMTKQFEVIDNPNPILEVVLSLEENGKPIDGSPHRMIL